MSICFLLSKFISQLILTLPHAGWYGGPSDNDCGLSSGLGVIAAIFGSGVHHRPSVWAW